MAVRIGLIGAAGRMGVALAEAIEAQEGAVLAGAIERAGHARVGQPILPGSSVLIRDDAAAVAAECDVLIDFSAPVALASSIALGKPLVIGTTGLEAAHHAAIESAAAAQPVLQSANMSLGVNLLAALVHQAAARLGDDWDIEIVEMHHRHKVDAPSGTALLLGEAAAEGRNISLKEHSERGRDGVTGPRARGAIGFAALRGGSVV